MDLQLTDEQTAAAQVRRLRMKSIPHLVWFVPAILLIVAATSDLPGGYYTFTRIVTCGIAAIIAFTGLRDRPVSQWSVPLALVAVLFNPLTPIQLNRETWVYLDFGAAVVFVAHLLFVRCAPYGLRIRRIFWTLALVALVPLVACGGLILSAARQSRSRGRRKTFSPFRWGSASASSLCWAACWAAE
jgi:hypothetical protein